MTPGPTPLRDRFAFLRWPLRPLPESVMRHPPDPVLDTHLAKARYSVRLLRYWWAAQAIREEARAVGRPLVVVDYGAGRGWLRRFVGSDVDARWIALDWRPERRLLERAGYDEILDCNFDEQLPLGDRVADVVVALHVFEHLPRPAVSAVEAVRILVEGGCLLAAVPTMPEALAGVREARFRSRLAAGMIARGGHINSLSPSRLRRLAADSGLEVEFVTGSHLVRHTGNPLENVRAWVRLNQLWGAIVPSLGSEACLCARNPKPLAWRAEELPARNGRPRALLVAAGLAALLAVGSLIRLSDERRESRVEAGLAAQLGSDAAHVVVLSHRAFPDVDPDARISFVSRLDEIPSVLAALPGGTHLVVHESHLDELAAATEPYVVDSRIASGSHIFYLLRQGADGSCLDHFLNSGMEPRNG